MSSVDDDFEKLVEDVAREGEPQFEPEEARVFARGLRAVNRSGIPYLVGGAFAKHAYTGIWRNTKDLDIFLKPDDLKVALDVLSAAGFETEVLFEHWLAKARREPYFIDLIFGHGHGQLQIDDRWFEHAQSTEITGVPARLIPLEELIVSKAYVAERYRYDGADILHLIHGAQGQIDWQRVLDRLGENRGLLLWHLVLFDFVYPEHADYLPQDLMVDLFEEMRQHWPQPQTPKAFRGTLIDPFSFVVDTEDWGYEDRRNLDPLVDEEGKPV